MCSFMVDQIVQAVGGELSLQTMCASCERRGVASPVRQRLHAAPSDERGRRYLRG